MSDHILGIDPGRSGAFAMLDPTEWRVTTYAAPDTAAATHQLIASLTPVRFAALERVFAGPTISKKAIAELFEHSGQIKALLTVAGIPCHLAPPAQWKPAMACPKDKAGARRRASELFPDDAEQWARAKDDGKAEAALISAYASQKWEKI